jgi:hypothetical protein
MHHCDGAIAVLEDDLLALHDAVKQRGQVGGCLRIGDVNRRHAAMVSPRMATPQLAIECLMGGCAEAVGWAEPGCDCGA